MATDYVTSPIKPVGQIVYAVGLGLFTFLIRMFGSYPEGVAFSILLMNCFVPLIERFGAQKRFGEVRNRA
ncbi:MAG TPA: RnfABCDGE type electron transport complex subunit D [Bacillota bacterium]|nr:RnfABCDGE type electron transport complex subunit D [Bacillota bacterium]